MPSLKIRYCAAALTALTACVSIRAQAEGNTAVVEGKVVEVVPSKKEIYVRNDDGKHEFYFNPSTTVTTEAKPGKYDDLKTGQQVKVTANKIGKRLDPLSVEILD